MGGGGARQVHLPIRIGENVRKSENFHFYIRKHQKSIDVCLTFLSSNFAIINRLLIIFFSHPNFVPFSLYTIFEMEISESLLIVVFNPKGCANKSRSCCICVNHSNYIRSEGGRGGEGEGTNDKDIGTLINTATRIIPMGIDWCFFLVITTQIEVVVIYLYIIYRVYQRQSL